MQTQKRFIAGAVCPRCAEMDRIVTYSTDEGQFRECVSCGFKDKLQDTPAVPVAELETRVNRVEKPQQDPDVQPLRFFKKPPTKH